MDFHVFPTEPVAGVYYIQRRSMNYSTVFMTPVDDIPLPSPAYYATIHSSQPSIRLYCEPFEGDSPVGEVRVSESASRTDLVVEQSSYTLTTAPGFSGYNLEGSPLGLLRWVNGSRPRLFMELVNVLDRRLARVVDDDILPRMRLEFYTWFGDGFLHLDLVVLSCLAAMQANKRNANGLVNTLQI
ncbi:uncharacterized protein TRIVIDRAFT_223019 [Trichoderma virens Gv29-8]|uniref:Uncharacterized protein n=1 Tax=Hypocrea virens (strain Gv29-8 / FGSC 10586) TaxID=413071 RepID=G9MVT1_HYPVG|nr:uncharacterized protein TRIVIDRAFT_223019 [Trichoderma virens Gv29-8]EHK21406.1 hypothetical protein TRIVIDRAFT_223019 [Trichoderma virens Gv29-8]UKZ53361.1 hypothetical protein TrVGV298_007153 [Trichoderma virens]